MTAWIEVLTALTSGRNLPIHGTVREVRSNGEPERVSFAWSGVSPPMLVPAGDGCRVWRHGDRLRVEHEDGRPIFVTDGNQAWDFTADAQRPRTGPTDRVHYVGSNQWLLRRRSAAEWSGDDFTRPIGEIEETEFVGRRCWTVELAPLARKPYPLRIWVEIESGQMLGFRSEHLGEGAQLVDLVVGDEIDDALFTWDGPVYTREEYQQMLEDERVALEREQQAWFEQTVTAAPIATRVLVDFTPESVPFRDPETGAFDAFNSHASLSRRLRSDEGWLPRWGGVHYAWSTPQWDWAASAIHHPLDDEAVHRLQQIVHPGEPVDRQRRINPSERGRVQPTRPDQNATEV